MDELIEKRNKLKEKKNITLCNMEKIAAESYRVAEVAHNSKEILDDLEKEFELQTGLKGNDIIFLFVAIGLQVTRIVVVNELTKIEKAGSDNRNETKLHEFQKSILKKFDTDNIVKEKPYYASVKHIISRDGVPYDATATLSEKSIQSLLKKDKTWDFDLNSFIPTEKIQLFKGANHRFATLGHDPILGLLFGTGNIMTNTITCIKTPVIAGGLNVPVLTTNHVVYTSDYKEPKIATYGSTAIMLKEVINRTLDEPSALVAALIKQIIHIGTDLYTPCGIQIPGANLLLSNTEVEKLTQYVSMGDLIKVGASAGVTELINMLISTIHLLMYDSTSGLTRDVYSVKTRKIIMYSNIIATTSNLIWVGANMMSGNEAAIRQLDLGGLMITIKRLISDKEYIRRIKVEFVLGGFNKMIQGEDLNLDKITFT